VAIRQKIQRYLIDPLRRWYFGAPPMDDAACPIYLPGEDNGRLQTGGDGEADAALLAAESAYIHQRRGGGSRSYRIGLALSGGGIRSATFSLGVMQRLARAGILDQIDYLSTVSGGGYIGSGLSWWLSGKSGSRHPYGLGKNDFPYGTDDPGSHTGDPEILRAPRRMTDLAWRSACWAIFAGHDRARRPGLRGILAPPGPFFLRAPNPG
jgi:hypothetical protein